MATYQCPLCGNRMERDLVLYLDHTEQHVIEQIKKEHPEWVEADGVCRPCSEYYRRQLSGESGDSNIGPLEQRKRLVMGVAMLSLSLMLAFGMKSSGAGRALHLTLFAPLFFGMLGFIQAREKTCALLAERELRNMDIGEGRVLDPAIAKVLKARGRAIFVKAFLSAALLTALFYLFL